MTLSEGLATRQARICAEMAETAPLANQREILLRSQAAWEAIAKREDATRAARERVAASKDAPVSE